MATLLVRVLKRLVVSCRGLTRVVVYLGGAERKNCREDTPGSLRDFVVPDSVQSSVGQAVPRERVQDLGPRTPLAPSDLSDLDDRYWKVNNALREQRRRRRPSMVVSQRCGGTSRTKVGRSGVARVKTRADIPVSALRSLLERLSALEEDLGGLRTELEGVVHEAETCARMAAIKEEDSGEDRTRGWGVEQNGVDSESECSEPDVPFRFGRRSIFQD